MDTMPPRLRRTGRLLAAACACGVLLAGVTACAQPVAYPYPYPPVPAPRVEVLPPAPPGERWIFQPGHWQWEGRDYAWIPGRWVERPVPGLQWAPGHWAWRVPAGWVWIPGHWR